MAQNVRIELTCDACKQEDIINVEAETMPPIAVGKYAPRIVDLCEKHSKELYDPLAILLSTVGRQDEGTQKRRRKPRKQAEPEPEVPTPAANLTTTKTKKQAAAAGRKKGDPQDTLWSRAQESAEHLCPEKGCERGKPGQGFPKPQGLGAHRARKHGYRTGDDT